LLQTNSHKIQKQQIKLVSQHYSLSSHHLL